MCLHLLKVLILKLQRMNYNRYKREMQGLFFQNQNCFEKELYFFRLCYIIHYVNVSAAAADPLFWHKNGDFLPYRKDGSDFAER